MIEMLFNTMSFHSNNPVINQTTRSPEENRAITHSPGVDSGVRQWRVRWRVSAFCVLTAGLLLAGCTTTGMKTAKDAGDLSRIKTIAVKIDPRPPFSLLLSGDRPGIAGALLLGVTGAAIEQNIRTGHDQKEAEKLSPALSDFDALEKLQEVLVASLRSSGRFESVTTNAGNSAQLLVTVSRWGLRPSLRRKKETKNNVQLGFEYVAKVIEPGQSKAVWELRDVYLHGKEYPLMVYQSDLELFKNDVKEAVEGAAIQLSKKVRLGLQPAKP